MRNAGTVSRIKMEVCGTLHHLPRHRMMKFLMWWTAPAPDNELR
jgi:hypothetical protein